MFMELSATTTIRASASDVSDADPADPRIRRVALGHALLSHAFGTGVLAVAINLVTNLGDRDVPDRRRRPGCGFTSVICGVGDPLRHRSPDPVVNRGRDDPPADRRGEGR
jgi:hypothetical protein